MKKSLTSFLLLTLLLGACSNGSAATEAEITKTPVAADIDPAATEQVITIREAVLSEIENNVSARALSSDEFSIAVNGMSIFETGGTTTSADSRVRIDLLPDGTIIRVGPNSSFTLSVLADENGEPKTQLELLFGQVFILLNGGSLDVETPSGVASVHGSLMSVTYSPDKNYMSTNCLEGHCYLEDEDEDMELTEGQAADFIDGDLPDEYRDMTFEELGLWVLDNPDLNEYIEEFPDLPDVPDDFNWDYDFANDPDFDFFYDPEYDPADEFFDPEFGPTEESGYQEGYATEEPGSYYSTEEPNPGTQEPPPDGGDPPPDGGDPPPDGEDPPPDPGY